MAEPLAAASPGMAGPERDVLLVTKLHMPVPQAGVVPRSRLAERLDEGLARGLILVCAPAGYGKTVMVANWARHGGYPAGWLSLDVTDNDPARFWGYVVAALDRACPGIGGRVGPLLGPPAPASFEPLLAALVNELAVRLGDEEALLVLDDYQVISSEPVHASLRFLLEQRPPGLHLVLASRSDPPLPLARLRARGQLAELRADQLRFTAGEAAALLRQAAGPDGALPDEIVAALAARTEGWAAGLQLAALSLRGRPDIAGFVADFTGSHRYVLDYLAEEVLERQPEQVRAFLLETSVLERLSGDLCDAVTGRAGSQALLERVEQAGLFLAPLDEVRGWWRYHQLFADLLRARLEADQPGRVAQLHRNAAGWCGERGLADEAIRHAVAAGEMTWAARLIEQHFDAVFYLRGETATIERWLAVLPADLIQSRPRLLLARAQMAAAGGRIEEVERAADAAERACASMADEPFEPTVGGAASLLVNVPAHIALDRSYVAQLRGDPEGTAEFASRALAGLGDQEWALKSIAQGLLAMAEWLRGRLAEAERAFASSTAGWRATGQHTVTAWGMYQLAAVQRARGRLDAAVQTCRQALEIAAEAGRAPLAAAGPAHVCLAEVSYQRNELDTALRHVTDGIALCRQFVYTAPLATGLATLARVRQATGDPAGALQAGNEAGQASPSPAGLLNPVPALHAQLLLAQGDVQAAARFTQEQGLDPGDEPDYPREPEQLLLARVLIAQDRPGQALPLLDRLRAAAVAQDRTGSLIEIGALRALALAACGQETAAVDILAGALTLACPQGYVRVFADEGPPMAALLARLIAAQRAGQAAAGVPLGYLARLQRAFGSQPPATGPGRDTVAVPGIVDPLTNRELEVLKMLAAGRSNQSIADELVVSLDTTRSGPSPPRPT